MTVEQLDLWRAEGIDALLHLVDAGELTPEHQAIAHLMRTACAGEIFPPVLAVAVIAESSRRLVDASAKLTLKGME